MRRIVSLIAAMLCATVISAQSDDNSISVASFKKLDNDLTARTQKKIDQNGEPCALIKVQVQSDGFIFEGDGLGIVTTVPKIDEGEYWVYVPRGAKYLTVKHKTLGVLRQYAYPVKIEKQCTYELRLSHKKVETEGNYLIISVEPKESAIYIDDEKLDSEIKSPFLQTGRHTYRVECENYVTDSGVVVISKAERSNLNLTLNRAKGYATINYQPEGTEIYIDSSLEGKTPAKIQLDAGEHTMSLKKEFYLEEKQTFKVTQDCNLSFEGELRKIPSGKIRVRSNIKYADIYIDDIQVGKTNGLLRSLIGKDKGIYETLVGRHYVRISKPGIIDRTIEVMAEEKKINSVLVKEPRPQSTSEQRRDERRAEKAAARERVRIENQNARDAEKQQNYEERLGKRFMRSGFRVFMGWELQFPIDAEDFQKGIVNDKTNTGENIYGDIVGNGMQFSLSMGMNIKPFWYLGVGGSYIYTYTGTTKYCWAVPLFLDSRVECFNRKVSPFVAFRLGRGLRHTPTMTRSDSDGTPIERSYNARGFYMSPSAGIRFNRLSLSLSYTNGMKIRDNNFKTPPMFSVGATYDFGARVRR